MNKYDKKKSLTAIRATFSVPPETMIEIEQIRDRLGRKSIHMNKSEVIRLALSILGYQTDKVLEKGAKSLPRLKAGRPVTRS